MTPADEIARLREQLRLANIDAVNLEVERNELARRLGAEVATTQRLKAALRGIVAVTADSFATSARFAYDMARAALASGNGDGK